ncbi:uncharacterized protein KY384_002339 [Bacidia gigantensis]|uniref:uncharacterized protein n=1 Tax=Bacidia gigantensis TaxID=2732470 RepID=UPI001D0435DA|nr:uncharacterized protein KY384_002339 [Bacidia gigantensis]KAG8532462.1 hypothetical protein KY384_002339 [Bacidia gigantensis]
MFSNQASFYWISTNLCALLATALMLPPNEDLTLPTMTNNIEIINGTIPSINTTNHDGGVPVRNQPILVLEPYFDRYPRNLPLVLQSNLFNILAEQLVHQGNDLDRTRLRILPGVGSLAIGPANDAPPYISSQAAADVIMTLEFWIGNGIDRCKTLTFYVTEKNFGHRLAKGGLYHVPADVSVIGSEGGVEHANETVL